jgi:ankyrin repeat protein
MSKSFLIGLSLFLAIALIGGYFYLQHREEEGRKEMLTSIIKSGDTVQLDQFMGDHHEMLNDRLEYGMFPIDIAVMSGNAYAVKFFINSGFDINVPEMTSHILEIGMQANHERSLDVLDLLAKNITSINTYRPDNPPLCFAAGQGYPYCGQVLLANKADVRLNDSEGKGPLFNYVEFLSQHKSGEADGAFIRLLVDNGDSQYAKNGTHGTPYEFAKKSGLTGLCDFMDSLPKGVKESNPSSEAEQ